MLQFDLRVTTKELEEETGNREVEFDYDEVFAIKMKEHLEYLVTNLPLVDGDRVFVLSIADISPVP